MHAVTDLINLFKKLSGHLEQNQVYWRPTAFHQLSLPWMSEHQPLVDKLFALSLEQIDLLAKSPNELAEFLAEDLSFAKDLYALSQLTAFESKAFPEVASRFYAGIPGRKWQQVQTFAQCIDDSRDTTLEWCAGKSHLGFYLNHIYHKDVVALEWDKSLVEQANQRATQQNVSLDSHWVDVLSEDAVRFLDNTNQAVALHACGELHEHLLKLGAARKVKQLHVAPCCYHKRQDEIYTPMSAIGKAVELSLNKTELHTAVMETVTAGATLRRQRKQLQIMRLGFDCLQREVLGKDEYLPIPSLPMSWSKVEFNAFCQHCAQLRGISLPDVINWSHYLKQGETRFKQVSALDLVRFLFRRPLEVWLALDRALLLEEQGYSVTLGTFCPSHITPRNILIKASFQAEP